MKQETIDQTIKGIPAVLGASVAWTLQDVSFLISIIVGIMTVMYIAVQGAYLLRKWWVQETTKAWLQGRHHSRLGDDSEHAD